MYPLLLKWIARIKLRSKYPTLIGFNALSINITKKKIRSFMLQLICPLAPLTKAQGFLFFLTNIFGSLKAIALIHVQALKLFFKKSNFFKYSQRMQR